MDNVLDFTDKATVLVVDDTSDNLSLMMELLKYRSGMDLLHVPYSGGGPALIDTVGGQVQMMIVPVVESEPLPVELPGVSTLPLARVPGSPTSLTLSTTSFDAGPPS